MIDTTSKRKEVDLSKTIIDHELEATLLLVDPVELKHE